MSKLTKLRDAYWQVEQDREFAAKHGYTAAYRRNTEELKRLEQKILRAKGLQ